MKELFTMFGAAFVAVIIVLVILWPLVVIWALNTLFAMGLAYTFINWLAVLVLTLTFGKARVTVNKGK
jgi:hypothetical protein